MQYWQHPNNVVFGGRITHDLQIKEPKPGVKILDFTIANNQRLSGEGGRTDKSHFVRCEAWGKTAEVIVQHFSKGDPIVVIGSLNWSQWQDKDAGQKREAVKVRVDTFHFVGSGGGNRENGAEPKSYGGNKVDAGTAESGKPTYYAPDPVDDTHIPF